MGFTLLADVPTTESVSPNVSPMPRKLGAIVCVMAVGLIVTFATADAGTTVTVTLFFVVPTAFVAASVYIVVAAGATITVPEVVCGVAVIPFNCSEVAPLTCHVSMALWPAVISFGVAVKLAMVGAEGTGGVGTEPPLLPPPPQAARKITKNVSGANPTPLLSRYNFTSLLRVGFLLRTN